MNCPAEAAHDQRCDRPVCLDNPSKDALNAGVMRPLERNCVLYDRVTGKRRNGLFVGKSSLVEAVTAE